MMFILLGLILGAVLCALWDVYLNGYLSIDVKCLEHFHAGIILGILSLFTPYPYSSILQGTGAFLIIDERYQVNPFAIGKSTFKDSLVIGIALVALLLVMLCQNIS